MESMPNCVSNDVDTQTQGEHVSAITASTTEAELMKGPRGVSLNNQMLRRRRANSNQILEGEAKDGVYGTAGCNFSESDATGTTTTDITDTTNQNTTPEDGFNKPLEESSSEAPTEVASEETETEVVEKTLLSDGAELGTGNIPNTADAFPMSDLYIFATSLTIAGYAFVEQKKRRS